jgi:hypothetical protein
MTYILHEVRDNVGLATPDGPDQSNAPNAANKARRKA